MANITGSVNVMAFGSHVEGFISNLIASGIKISDLKNESGVFYFTCARVRYKNIAKTASRYGVRTKPLERTGVYFKVRPYFKRYGTLLGVFGYLMAIYILSGYVWDITISGNESVSDKQILEIMESSGVGIGAKGTKINREYAELTAMLELDMLAWINIEVNGSRVDIKMSERTVSDSTEIPVNIPCNVIALKKGVIAETEVYGGKLLIPKGSGVNKGDIIVSGTVEDGAGNILLQHADAKIIAECEDISEFFVPFNTREQRRSGEVIDKNYAIFLGNEIPLFINGDVPINSLYSEEVKKMKLLLFDLPVRIKTCSYEVINTVDVNLTNDMVIGKLDEMTDLYIENMFSGDEVVSRDTEYIPGDDGIKAVLIVRYKTNIASKEPIGLG